MTISTATIHKIQGETLAQLTKLKGIEQNMSTCKTEPSIVNCDTYKRERRINKEFYECLIRKIDGIIVIPLVNTYNEQEKIAYDMNKWSVYMHGPINTAYYGGIFILNIHFGSRYPIEVPDIKFVTKIYHVDILNTGQICIDSLSDGYSPALTVRQLLITIRDLLSTPFPPSYAI